jgi:hypothetical protein
MGGRINLIAGVPLTLALYPFPALPRSEACGFSATHPPFFSFCSFFLLYISFSRLSLWHARCFGPLSACAGNGRANPPGRAFLYQPWRLPPAYRGPGNAGPLLAGCFCPSGEPWGEGSTSPQGPPSLGAKSWGGSGGAQGSGP